MKPLKFSILFLFTLLIVACSDDSSDVPNVIPVNGSVGNYFPSSLNNYWNYDIISTDNNTGQVVNTVDSLYVSSQVDPNFTLSANDTGVASGAMNGLLTSGTLSKSNTALILDGSLALPPEITALIDFDIVLNDMKLYDTAATNGQILSSNSNLVQQDFNGIPLSINYTLSTQAMGFDESINLNGDNYTNVTSAKIILNIKVVATITVSGFTVPVTVLEAQDVLAISNYFAQDIGLARSEANTSYQISPTALSALAAAGINLGVPDSGSSSNTQELSSYFIAE